MGNTIANKMATSQACDKILPSKVYEPVSSFKFHDPFPEDTNNGLYLNGFYFPEEVVVLMLSYLEPNQLLRASQVCKKWCNIIKSDSFWGHIYSRQYGKKPKKLPWYVYYCFLATNYFDTNLLKNGNGQQQYLHWKIMRKCGNGDEFKIEDPPIQSDPLPEDVPEFNGQTSCFVTSYYDSNKFQGITFDECRLMQLILDKYKPHIYMSEWITARYDWARNDCCRPDIYRLYCKLFGGKEGRSPKVDSHVRLEPYEYAKRDFNSPLQYYQFEQKTVMGLHWSKVELLVKEYPAGVRKIVFQHEAGHVGFWFKGTKMAGGVVKILFDSIEPLG